MLKILGYLLMFGGLFIVILGFYLDMLLWRNGNTSVFMVIAYLVLYVSAGVFFFLLGKKLID